MTYQKKTLGVHGTDVLHLERVLPVMEAPVKDRAGGGPWLHVFAVLGDDTRIMVFWPVPSEAYFDMPPHFDTSLHRDLLGGWRTHRPLFPSPPWCIPPATPNMGGSKTASHGPKTPRELSP